MNKEKTIQYIENLIKKGNEVLNTQHTSYNDIFGHITYVDDDMFNEYKSLVDIFLLSNDKLKNSYNEFKKKSNMTTNFKLTKKYISILNALKSSIEGNIIEIVDEPKDENIDGKCIFVGHGRSKLWNEVVRFLKDDLKIGDINYFEKDSHVGRSIADALRDFRKETNFAIIVMTAEDETAQKTRRTRQNVIHEIGFFQGKLGFEKVAILKQEGVESFSNIDGIQYIPFSSENIKQTFYELQKMLKRENMI